MTNPSRGGYAAILKRLSCFQTAGMRGGWQSSQRVNHFPEKTIGFRIIRYDKGFPAKGKPLSCVSGMAGFLRVKVPSWVSPTKRGEPQAVGANADGGRKRRDKSSPLSKSFSDIFSFRIVYCYGRGDAVWRLSRARTGFPRKTNGLNSWPPGTRRRFYGTASCI